jgi:GNAT superfamily N-acetyltransferase
MGATSVIGRPAPWWVPVGPSDIPMGRLVEVDPDRLVPLRRSVLRDGRRDLPASYASDGEPSTLHLAVVDPDDSVVGGVTVVVDPLPGAATLRLALMAVAPALQGRGVGRALVASVQSRAAGAGLAVWAAARVSALPFYGRLGFHPRGDIVIGSMDLPHRRVLWRPDARVPG